MKLTCRAFPAPIGAGLDNPVCLPKRRTQLGESTGMARSASLQLANPVSTDFSLNRPGQDPAAAFDSLRPSEPTRNRNLHRNVQLHPADKTPLLQSATTLTAPIQEQTDPDHRAHRFKESVSPRRHRALAHQQQFAHRRPVAIHDGVPQRHEFIFPGLANQQSENRSLSDPLHLLEIASATSARRVENNSQDWSEIVNHPIGKVTVL